MATDGPLAARLATLLAGHNHIVRNDPTGRVAKVIVLETRPLGAHHQVEARLTGPDGAVWEVLLIVDTGATTLVLPSSWMARLGFAPGDLSPGRVRTAGGLVATRTGRVATVKIGRARRDGVAFIDDAQLGDKALLGMSFLGQFRFELDRTGNRLVLFAR